MKIDKIIITILCVLCIGFLITNIFLSKEYTNLKNKIEKDKKVNEFYICELDAGDEEFKYKYRNDIYYDKEGTLIEHWSGTTRIVDTEDELNVIIKEAKMFNHYYKMLGEKEIYLYDKLDVKENDTETWYEDILNGLKSSGYECRKTIIKNEK